MPATPLHPGGLSREERIGLAIAIALHVGLVAWLALDRLSKDIQPPPERMTVSFAEAVAPEAVSPQTAAQAAPDLAPTLGEPAPEPLPVVEPMPEPEPAPMPRTVTTPQARPVLPAAKPAVRATAAPRTPQAPASKSAPAKPAAGKPAQSSAKPGASRIGNDFLKGVGGEARGTSQTPPAANVGPQVAASLSQAISRELKPHWSAPQGVEADQLVTVLAFDLNEDGSLAGAAAGGQPSGRH
jgi:outer membrane biosynthesis protein TonB